MAGVVAIVGRANVGKSTIFNRMVGERISIVEDVAGVTRDRIYAKASWLTKEFSVIDTGGIELENASFTTQIKMQAEIAIEEADVIVFVVNGREGITKEDEYVARLLQKSRKPIILVVNKIDDNQFRDYIYEFYALGVGDPIPVSGSHGIGIGDLLDQIINQLDLQDEETNEDEISFSIIGRPNVGKSSLTNAIMGDDEIKTSHVSDKSKRGRHTTTTSKYYVWEDNSSIIDTPGIRSLDVSSFNPIEIQDYFPEFENWKDKCKYNDCLHFNEPYDSCIVKQGVASGLISPERYESYLRIMGDVLGEKDYESILNEVAPDFKKKTNFKR